MGTESERQAACPGPHSRAGPCALTPGPVLCSSDERAPAWGRDAGLMAGQDDGKSNSSALWSFPGPSWPRLGFLRRLGWRGRQGNRCLLGGSPRDHEEILNQSELETGATTQPWHLCGSEVLTRGTRGSPFPGFPRWEKISRGHSSDPRPHLLPPPPETVLSGKPGKVTAAQPTPRLSLQAHRGGQRHPKRTSF